MTSFNVLLFVLAVLSWCLLFWLNRTDKINAPSKVVEDIGEKVILRQTLFSRATMLGGKSVNKSDIYKLQRAGIYLTLFHKSGNAYDIWISASLIGAVTEHCKSVLPHAEYIEVQS